MEDYIEIWYIGHYELWDTLEIVDLFHMHPGVMDESM